ncbi:MAG: DsbC family protein [Desulfuromonadales bacterium]|nr:DsbC family protein [Desulfuromonadales bacterium]
MKPFVSFFLFLLLCSGPLWAKGADGCGAGTCASCHSMAQSEAEQILDGLVDKVFDVQFAEVPGMWLVEVEKDRNRFPVYIDFSKQYLLSGNVIRLADLADASRQAQTAANRVDVSRIPLDDALLLGSPRAQTRVIVFTDPECPYCRKLHVELHEVVRRDPQIAFYIKMFPLKMHPNAYDISRSIVCNRSMELLEASFAGKPVPPALCDATAVDETLALVRELGIRSTPTLVLPDGLVVPGYKTADDLLARIRPLAARQ